MNSNLELNEFETHSLYWCWQWPNILLLQQTICQRRWMNTNIFWRRLLWIWQILLWMALAYLVFLTIKNGQKMRNSIQKITQNKILNIQIFSLIWQYTFKKLFIIFFYSSLFCFFFLLLLFKWFFCLFLISFHWHFYFIHFFFSIGIILREQNCQCGVDFECICKIYCPFISNVVLPLFFFSSFQLSLRFLGFRITKQVQIC